MNLNDLAKECFQTSKDHGFHDPPKSVGEDIALMHSELSEALEDHRRNKAPNAYWYEDGKLHLEDTGTHRRSLEGHLLKPCGIPSEMADVIVRVLDFCGAHKIDIARAVSEKMAYNQSRPFRHGNKKL